MRDFRKFDVWQKAHELTCDVYQLTARFPDDERFGVTQQMRRAAVSIPANLAEGCGRNSDRELARFADMASGSTSELEYYFIFARRQGWIQDDAYEARAQEIRRMLWGLIQTLRPEA